MDAEFWHQMWQQPQQGFDQPQPNHFLTRYWSALKLKGNETVLVPLCGKSVDMTWLVQQGHSVLGVELSRKALDAFVAEHHLSAEPLEHAVFEGHQTAEMRLFCGDFFKLSAHDCSEVSAFYDRAALVALPADMRQRYAAHLAEVCADGVSGLLVVMDYDQTAMSGPPFSVSDHEVVQLFSEHFDLQKIASETLQRKGVQITESVHLCQRKSR
ncbi:MAG: thiopurine S-methyltransferase [Piscirickettsiaceae bacterium CG_4_9_14_3_um_filter_43_564]|nr:thiopurine S-methyltransferase [Thiomicrospira sp.]OIP96032.1 MAG: thiopurine S-methyltransferase [Thiomicrospira sp. CG2_30_44_34]PIQ06019.1 MAG: thiopurine S-methyltransferase [Piscirickettsiaceae bacterium CG18_big_fil_WC_8_21_14_2_50_44_103]PIU38178.1 MAG: thiopurine S-methyltransferase [Piscirickettsiaceae bacterium CG07_land_8_20_14_0_80_44_28]PIW58795.1 MAG: thiopurine S-methyltransferase [Piscirickettsiaceae bacterium CG12_big_fil_rev_8_21_14_0_65_44_934]PIW78643.1 MAG: thiopurine S